MSVLAWIIVSGLAVSAIALVGRVSVLGGAMFHMVPESVNQLGNVRSC